MNSEGWSQRLWNSILKHELLTRCPPESVTITVGSDCMCNAGRLPYPTRTSESSALDFEPDLHRTPDPKAYARNLEPEAVNPSPPTPKEQNDWSFGSAKQNT